MQLPKKIPYHKKSKGYYVSKIQAVFWAIGRHAFLAVLCLILLDFFIGQFLLYRYVLSPPKDDSGALGIVVFDGQAYERVEKAWQDRQAQLEAILQQSYENPFN